ncbi:MAG TPA: phosphotransferase [Intrasporangium sp.]|nr:phosphotransferase [Intrasporangium sp.]
MTLSPAVHTSRAPVAREAMQPLPLPTPGWGPVEALAALGLGRPQLPVQLPADVTVVSALTTVVIRAGEHAVKVYPPGTCSAHLDQIATRLEDSLTAHPAEPGAVDTAFGVVTVAPWLTETGEASWSELGTLLRRFHTEHDRTDLPLWQPLSRLVSQVAGLDVEHAAVLLAARAALLAALSEVRSELGYGVIHGDVSPSNVMLTPDGPRLIDLDWAAVGPREYDLAGAARRVAAGEISVEDYGAFCDAYGFDVRTWPGLPVLNKIADLGGVAFRLWDDRHHGRSLDWVPAEVELWRSPV